MPQRLRQKSQASVSCQTPPYDLFDTPAQLLRTYERFQEIGGRSSSIRQ